MNEENKFNVTFKVTDAATYVIGKLSKNLYQEFKKALGYKDPNAIWRGKKFANWDGYITTVCYNKAHCRCAVKKDGIHFPTGLYSKAVEFCRAYGVEVKTEDQRTSVKLNTINLSSNPAYPPRDYQQEIITQAIKQQRGIIKLATGGGKTRVGAGIISQLAISPFIFYVTSQDLLVQAKEEFEKFIVQNNLPLQVGVIGDGKCDIRDVNVMTVQTAVRAVGAKYRKFDDEDTIDAVDKSLESKYEQIASLIKNCQGFIADETQHWAAETCQVIADHSVSARYRWGLSATPWRDLGDDMLIDACFGKIVADISASYLIRKNILVKPTIYFVHIRKKFDDDAITYADAYKLGIVQNDERNGMIAKIAQNMVKQGRNVLILVRTIEHGETLEKMIDGSVFVHGSHSNKTRIAHISDMRSKKISVTIATSIFDEGVDVKPLDGLILAGSGKSQTRALQRIGRVIRTYEDKQTGFVKKDAYIVDFHDNMKYMLSHSKARRRIYETEPEFVIRDFKVDD